MENNQFKTLKKKTDFNKLKLSGKRYYPSSWLIINYTFSEDLCLEAGWTVPRYVGNAVMRNKFKRWSRVILRDTAKRYPSLKLKLNIVFKKKDKEFYKKLSYENFETDMFKFFTKISKQS